MRTVVLLGPQRHRPTVREAVAAIGVEGPIAAVTAGWEERENEIDELTEHLERPVSNLGLHARAEQVFERDPELLEAYRERRRRRREQRDLYGRRLRHLLQAVRELERRPPGSDILDAERTAALESVRELDTHQLERMTEIREEFDETWRPWERESVALHRSAVAEQIRESGALAIAGGHVAVLLNRLRLFGVAEELGDRPVLAWSAGAMAISDTVVLYHDSPPQGRGDARVLDRGLGLCTGIVALPHASRRLQLDEPTRVARLARRFAPRACVALDDASGLIFDAAGSRLFGDGARRLSPRGVVVGMAEKGAA